MSYMMCSRITFPANKRREELVIYTISSVHIESSWKMLTDSAEIVLPRRIKYFAGKDLKELLSAGDQVKIELGYDSNLYTEFEGYISLIGWCVPETIRCEDEMYNLKRKTVSYSAKNVTLKKLLADVAKGYEVKTNYDAELGAVRYSSSTVAEILYCGNVYSEKVDTEKVKIVLEKNAVSQNLNETNGEFQVKVVSIGAGGKKLEAKAGTEGSEVYNLTYNEKGKSVKVEDLKKFARDFYESLKKQKYRGGVELFGIPVVRHGITIDLKSEITPEMNGYYYVEKVTKDFSDDATYRQKLELGGRAE